MQQQEGDWKGQQTQTFLRWINSKLKKIAGGRQVTSLKDLSDGVALCQLLESLFPETKMPRYNAQPKLPAHKLDNLAVVFKFLENADIRVLTKPQNVVEGNETMVLGLLWTLILEFDINRTMKAAQAAAAVQQGKDAFNFKPGQAKDALLAWVRSRVARYGMQPNDFGRDFCDGNVLLGIIHSLRPDLWDWRTMDRSNPAQNVGLALRLAEEKMGIPALIEAGMLLGGNPDEKSVMAYVVQFLMYEQENRDMINRLNSNIISNAEAEAAAERKRREQEQLLAQQQQKMQELQRQHSMLEQQKAMLAQQQQQMAALEAQKQQMLAMQQAQLAEQQRRMQELEAQRQQAALMAQQQQLLAQQQQQAALLAQQQQLLQQQQQQQQQQLQMAAEVARMKFFQAMQNQQREGIGARDYVLFIDKSGSMAGSRWTEARKAVEGLAPQITRACPQGVSMYFFNDECVRIDQVTTAQQVQEFFKREKPDRGTNLSLALMHAFDVHFKTKQGKPETWLIVTDGAPDRPTHVWEILKENYAKFRSPNEITISFIQIGSSTQASDYLRKLRGSLPIVDTVTQEELPQGDFSQLFQARK